MANLKELSPIWKCSLPGTRLGIITCGVTQNGLASLSFGDGADVDDKWHPSTDPFPTEIEQTLRDALNQIRAYLDGQLKEFVLPLDLSRCTEFQKRVLTEVSNIPYGQVITYGQIAEKVGGMKHVRAVGGAVGSNPIPIVIPCHRVVSTGGHLRGYSGWGGIRTKAWLLQLEGQQLIAEELD